MTREEAIEILKRKIRRVHPCDEPAYEMAIKALRQEIKIGDWIDIDEGFSPCECSECETVEFKRSKYCPNCGARMVKDEK